VTLLVIPDFSLSDHYPFECFVVCAARLEVVPIVQSSSALIFLVEVPTQPVFEEKWLWQGRLAKQLKVHKVDT
jgi:hypothetical protein